jgi:hypothetical protein
MTRNPQKPLKTKRQHDLYVLPCEVPQGASRLGRPVQRDFTVRGVFAARPIRVLWQYLAAAPCTLLLINSVVLFTYCGDIAQYLHVPTAAPRSTCTLLLINSVVLFTYYSIPSQHTRAAANTEPSGCV